MIKTVHRFFIIASFLLLLLYCDKKQDLSVVDKPQAVELSPQMVTEFPYVSMKQSGTVDDPAQLVQDFIEETKKQHVIPTGPLFVIFYQMPNSGISKHGNWEIGLPTAEGTLVQEPLRLKNWKYDRVRQAQSIRMTPTENQISPWLSGFIETNDLNSQPMIVIRIIDNIDSISFTHQLKSEVWVPVGFTSGLAE